MILLFVSPLLLVAQSIATVRGVVRDSSGRPLVGANVALYRQTNTGPGRLVAGATSDAMGGFAIRQVPLGTYTLDVTYIGYLDYRSELQVSSQLDLGVIKLRENAQLLGEVVVQGRATDMTIRGDTIAFNANAYKTPQGAMLEELVKRLPGAEIDGDGQVTIGGQEVSKILLDGKEFFSGDAKIAMRNLPASIVEQVEVYDRQSDESRITGFNSDDEQTVINIRTRPDQRQGIFGQTLVGYGLYNRYALSGMLNHFSNRHQLTLLGGSNNTNGQGLSDLERSDKKPARRPGRGRRPMDRGNNGITTSAQIAINETYTPNKRLEVNADARYGHSESELSTRSKTENILPSGPSSFTHETAEALSRSDNLGGDAFAKWQVTDRTEIVYRPAVHYNWGISSKQRNYSTTDASDHLIHKGAQESAQDRRGLRLLNMLLVGHKLNDEGRTLSTMVDLRYLDDISNMESHSSLQTKTSLESQRNLIEDRSHTINYRVRTGYVEPLTDIISLQAQLEWSDQLRSSVRDHKKPDATGAWTLIDETLHSQMNTRLSSLSGGIDLKMANKQLDLTVGLRLSPTWMSTQQTLSTNTRSHVRRETNWVPSLDFHYTPTPQTVMRISYWGRSEMPSATQMYSIPDNTNLQETVIGNPNLSPSYQHELLGLYRTFIPATSQAIFVHLFGSYTHHAVIKDQTVDSSTQRRHISYTNAQQGVYMLRMDGSFTTPLFIQLLSLDINLGATYDYSLSRINGVTNGSHVWAIIPNLSLAYTNSWLYLRAKGGVKCRYSNQDVQLATPSRTYDWTVGGDLSVTLPLGFKIESETTYTKAMGYQYSYNVSSILWNAGLSYSFLKNRVATIRLKVYDLLNQQESITRQVSASEIRDIWSDSLGRYAMLHFIYRFRL